jgi:hypothetical protein
MADLVYAINMTLMPLINLQFISVHGRDTSNSTSLRKEYKMTSTVYIVSRPRENKFGWTPDLTDAARYGKLKIVFEPEDKPQFNPAKAIVTARKAMEGFNPDDFLLWPGGGDPIAVMVACMIASEESEEVNILRWERNFNEGERDRRKGWYLPVKLDMA